MNEAQLLHRGVLGNWGSGGRVRTWGRVGGCGGKLVRSER